MTLTIANNYDLPVDHGLAITAVGARTPAEAAGLETNDIIVSVDGQDVENNGQLLSILAKHRDGDRVSIEYYRGGDRQSTDVTLGSRPDG